MASIGQTAEQASQYVQQVLEDDKEHRGSVEVAFTLACAPISNVPHDVIRAQSQDDEIDEQQDHKDELHHADTVGTAGGAPVHPEVPSVPPTCEGGADDSKHGQQGVQDAPANQIQDYQAVCAPAITGYT